jgi:hypothetical protein
MGLAVLAYALALRFASEHARATPRRLLGLWLAGAAAPTLPLALWWGAVGAWPAMFRQLVVFPLTTYAKTSAIPMPWFASGQDAAARWQVAAFYLPLAVLAGAGAALGARAIRRRPDAGDAGRAFLLALSGAFYLQVLTRSDLEHLQITLPPLFALAGLCVAEAMRAAARSGSIAARVVLPLALIGFAAFAIPALAPAVLPELGEPRGIVTGERGGVRLEDTDARLVAALVGAVAGFAKPDQPILALPYQPMIYFLGERRNPTRWNYLWPGDQSEQDYRELVAEARRGHPALVVLWQPEAMRSYAAPVLEYVEAEFAFAGQLGPFALYRPH